MDPHTIVVLLVPVLIKYLVNFGNFLEDTTKNDFPNIGKQVVVVALAYIATTFPLIQPYLPQISPYLQTALIAVLATLSHHLIELVVAWQKQLGGYKPARKGEKA